MTKIVNVKLIYSDVNITLEVLTNAGPDPNNWTQPSERVFVVDDFNKAIGVLKEFARNIGQT